MALTHNDLDRPYDPDDDASDLPAVPAIDEPEPCLCAICHQTAGADCQVVDGQTLCFGCFYAEAGGD